MKPAIFLTGVLVFFLVGAAACKASPGASSPVPTATFTTTSVVTTTVTATATVTASASPTVTTPSPTATVIVDILRAPIHEVDVRFAESFPVQVFLYVKGGLPDGCSKFHGFEIKERRGNTIFVEVTYDHPRDTACPAIYGFFEQNINLGTDFKSGESYTVTVNDVSNTFVMQ